MQKSISPKITALTFGILVLVFAVGFYIFAWQEPTQAPPGGNVPPPVTLNTDQTITGLKTFNPLSGLVPFLVDATKTGVVSNLNADKLDSYNAADLIVATGGEKLNGWAKMQNFALGGYLCVTTSCQALSPAKCVPYTVQYWWGTKQYSATAYNLTCPAGYTKVITGYGSAGKDCQPGPEIFYSCYKQ